MTQEARRNSATGRSGSRRLAALTGALFATAFLVLSPAARAAEWRPVEQTSTYAVAGATGAELYASIGRNGPLLGAFRAIAHTGFKLTWARDYQVRGSACVLASARPRLTITYTLPRVGTPLPAALGRRWKTFIDGVANHERVHGRMIGEMVRAIEAETVGLTVADDPGCRKIRSEMTKRLSALSLAQRQKSRDFDRAELGDGGNVHRLVLDLVNGP